MQQLLFVMNRPQTVVFKVFHLCIHQFHKCNGIRFIFFPWQLFMNNADRNCLSFLCSGFRTVNNAKNANFFFGLKSRTQAYN